MVASPVCMQVCGVRRRRRQRELRPVPWASYSPVTSVSWSSAFSFAFSGGSSSSTRTATSRHDFPSRHRSSARAHGDSTPPRLSCCLTTARGIEAETSGSLARVPTPTLVNRKAKLRVDALIDGNPDRWRLRRCEGADTINPEDGTHRGLKHPVDAKANHHARTPESGEAVDFPGLGENLTVRLRPAPGVRGVGADRIECLSSIIDPPAWIVAPMLEVMPGTESPR